MGIRKKFYVSFIFMIAGISLGFNDAVKDLMNLPTILGMDAFIVMSGFVYLFFSIVMIEYFFFYRIRILREDLKKVTDGNYDSFKKVVPIESHDEISCIVRSINKIIEDSVEEKKDLRFKNRLYLSLANDSPLYVCRFRKNGEITYVNQSYANAFGREDTSLIGEDITNLIVSGEDRYGELKRAIRVLTPTSPTTRITFDFPNVIGEEGPSWIVWSVSAIFNQNDLLQEYQLVGLNLHNKSIKEETKKDPDNIFIVGTSGKVKYVMSNEMDAEVLGEQFSDYVHPDWKEQLEKDIAIALLGKSSVISNLKVKHKGKYIFMQASLSLFEDVSKKEKNVIVELIDVTYIRDAQTKVRGAVDDMNQLIDTHAYSKSTSKS